tara:strand:- start:20690 stop:21982 length:1293 start_codon:yes stop_codon:yes gene_type:complete
MYRKTALYTTFLFAIMLNVNCKNDNKEELTSVTLKNTANLFLMDKEINLKKELIHNSDKTKYYPIVIDGNDTIPSQTNDIDNDGEWDELFFVMNFEPNQSKNIQLIWVDKMPKYVVRTSARFGKRTSSDTPVKPATKEIMLANELPKSLGYQQYQTDGPSWENDKIGFRHYLDGRNAKDLFGKKSSKMSPENVGINANGEVEDNYHVMEYWGRDILAVGNSVGLGGYALATASELMRLGVTVDDSINNIEKTTFQIRTEGPVKSVLDFSYENWEPNDRTYSVNETTTIVPGKYCYQNTVTINGLKGDENLVVGLVNINNDMPLQIIEQNDDYVILLTHDKQTYNKEWWLGMALLVPKNKYLGYTEAPKTGKLSNTYLAKLKIENNNPVNYYAVAGWELSDIKFKDPEYFKAYAINLADQFSAKIDITIEN